MSVTRDVRIDVGLLTVSREELAADTSRPLLLLLHGRGSNERDLAAHIAGLPQRFAFGLLRAPLPWGEGYSWFSTPEATESLPSSAAASAVERWLDEKGLDSPEREISLLGFSGGAVTSLELLRRRPSRYTSVVNLSGYVRADGDVLEPLPDGIRPRVFWGRADVDGAIPEAEVERTGTWLRANTDLTEKIYPGIAHSISDEEIADVKEFLA